MKIFEKILRERKIDSHRFIKPVINYLTGKRSVRATLYLCLILSITLINSCKMKVEPGIYLIPEQFNGRVTIFLGHPKGAPMEHEGEYRIFRINEKGCCISQFEAQYDE